MLTGAREDLNPFIDKLLMLFKNSRDTYSLYASYVTHIDTGWAFSQTQENVMKHHFPTVLTFECEFMCFKYYHEIPFKIDLNHRPKLKTCSPSRTISFIKKGHAPQIEFRVQKLDEQYHYFGNELEDCLIDGMQISDIINSCEIAFRRTEVLFQLFDNLLNNHSPFDLNLILDIKEHFPNFVWQALLYRYVKPQELIVFLIQHHLWFPELCEPFEDSENQGTLLFDKIGGTFNSIDLNTENPFYWDSLWEQSRNDIVSLMNQYNLQQRLEKNLLLHPIHERVQKI